MKKSTEELIVQTLRILDPNADLDDFRFACKRLIKNSDLVEYTRRTYSTNEVSKLGDGVFLFITQASKGIMSSVDLEKDHDLIGTSVRLEKLARIISYDTLQLRIKPNAGVLATGKQTQREVQASDPISVVWAPSHTLCPLLSEIAVEF